MGVGLMAFSVILSVIDQPHHALEDTLETDRRAQQLHADNKNRELVKGRGTLRIAAFGSSNMWGAGLLNRYDAIPYRLSDEVDNYAMFAGGPNFPSVCTETIVGDDDMYDVILLEYWLKARQGVPELARRLRQRFPNALMFFVKVWGPMHARRRPTEHAYEEEITFAQWRDAQLLPDHQVNTVVKALKTDDGYWFFPDHQEADYLINSVRKEVGGFHVRIPKKDTAKETLEFFLYFFNHENAQLSPLGHDFLANMTRATITNKLMQSSTQDLIKSGMHGHWGRGDSCHMWLTTGGYSREYSPSLVMHEFDEPMGKFALEVTGPGWFTVNNKFEDERTLYISFLSTAPGFYPVSAVTVGETGVPMDLIPHEMHDARHAQPIRTVAFGKIQPGDTRIYITPKQETDHFFRLVGVSITNEIAVPLEYGFGPEFNH